MMPERSRPSAKRYGLEERKGRIVLEQGARRKKRENRREEAAHLGHAHVCKDAEERKLNCGHLPQFQVLHDKRAEKAKADANQRRAKAGEKKLRDDLRGRGRASGWVRDGDPCARAHRFWPRRRTSNMSVVVMVLCMPMAIMVRVSTMETASFNTLSPKTSM